MSSRELRVEEGDESILVGVDGDRVSGSVVLELDADEDDVEETLRDLYQEVRHSSRVLGREL